MKDKKKLNSCQKSAQELAICMHNKRRGDIGKVKETARRAKKAKDKEVTKAKEKRVREQKLKKQPTITKKKAKVIDFDSLGKSSDDYLFTKKPKKPKDKKTKNKKK